MICWARENRFFIGKLVVRNDKHCFFYLLASERNPTKNACTQEHKGIHTSSDTRINFARR